jgi:hypothetical protein
MSDSSRGIIIGVVILAVIVAFVWYRGNQRPEVGACTLLASSSQMTIYYRVGDSSFATYTSPDCSSQSRVSV